MKNLFKYFGTGSLLAVVILSGCLKNNSLYTDYTNPKPLADINLSNLSNVTDSSTIYWLDIMPTASQWLDTAIAVHLSDAQHVGNVTFQMEVATNDPDFQSFYNFSHELSDMNDNYDDLDSATQVFVDSVMSLRSYGYLEIMPDSLYQIPNLSVSIPNAGLLNVGLMDIKFRTGAVDADGNLSFLNHNYVLPIAIKDASGYEVASNFRIIFLIVSPKNQYDGKYKYTTSANTSLVPNASKTVTLYTAGLYRLHFGLLGTYSNDVYYDIDPNTNLVTVECPSLGVQTPQDTRSHYDPATKTFYVYWKQGNGGRTFEETFQYLGPR